MRAGAASVAVAVGTVARSQGAEPTLSLCAATPPRAGTARESAEPCKSSSKQPVSSVATETVFVILWFSGDRQSSDGDSLFLKLESPPSKTFRSEREAEVHQPPCLLGCCQDLKPQELGTSLPFQDQKTESQYSIQSFI